jgi:hypothetical protein
MHAVAMAAVLVAAVYGIALSVLFVAQRRLVFRADPSHPDPGRAGVPHVRPLSVTTSDGLDLLAWFVPPADPQGHVVLYLHGNAGHIGHRAWRIDPLTRHGWGVLMLEYRGYGGNPGVPSEPGLRLDARAGLTALAALGFGPDRVLLWGESLGTGLAVGLAVEHPVAAVLLEAPYTSLAAIARRRYPFAPVGLLMRDPFDSLTRIGAIRAPVLIMHGARDAIVPVAMGQALHAAAPAVKHLWICEQADHDDLIDHGAADVARAFVATVTGSGPRGGDREVAGRRPE